MMQLAITEVEGDFFTSRKNGRLLTGERNYSASKRNYSLECIHSSVPLVKEIRSGMLYYSRAKTSKKIDEIYLVFLSVRKN